MSSENRSRLSLHSSALPSPAADRRALSAADQQDRGPAQSAPSQSRACDNPWCERLLIKQLQRKLYQARRIGLAGYVPELRRPERHPRIRETRMIEKVEELRAELQVHPAVVKETIVLDERHVYVVRVVVTYIRQGPAGVAEGESGRLAEYAGVEPLIQHILGGAVQPGTGSVIIRPRTSSERISEVGRGGQKERRPAFVSVEAVELPAGYQIMQAARTVQPLLARAERKLGRIGDDQPVSAVESIQRTLERNIVVVLKAGYAVLLQITGWRFSIAYALAEGVGERKQ